ncbi:MAG: hypothetical protein KF905_00555 [Flavobacteriales bacterium]|nr:hypothetical protein [Flavobacteriales bacterium]
MKAFWMGLLALVPFFSGCSKEPGSGGRAELRGRVVEQRYSSNTGQPVGQPYVKAEQRVYIIYGDGSYHDDDVRTGPDGKFRFPWLRKGDYTVYTISECGNYNGCTFSVSAKGSIGSNKDVVEVGDLNIQNW